MSRELINFTTTEVETLIDLLANAGAQLDEGEDRIGSCREYINDAIELIESVEEDCRFLDKLDKLLCGFLRKLETD